MEENACILENGAEVTKVTKFIKCPEMPIQFPFLSKLEFEVN